LALRLIAAEYLKIDPVKQLLFWKIHVTIPQLCGDWGNRRATSCFCAGFE
jgi:hypothetical protein